MKRSTTVTLTLLSGVATSFLAACGGGGTRRCVDDGDRVVPDSMCARSARSGGGIGMIGAWYPYRYYYGGTGFRGIGSRMSGGSYAAPRAYGGRAYGGSAHVGGGTSRGGFGATGRGSGGAHG